MVSVGLPEVLDGAVPILGRFPADSVVGIDDGPAVGVDCFRKLARRIVIRIVARGKGVGLDSRLPEAVVLPGGLVAVRVGHGDLVAIGVVPVVGRLRGRDLAGARIDQGLGRLVRLAQRVVGGGGIDIGDGKDAASYISSANAETLINALKQANARPDLIVLMSCNLGNYTETGDLGLGTSLVQAVANAMDCPVISPGGYAAGSFLATANEGRPRTTAMLGLNIGGLGAGTLYSRITNQVNNNYPNLSDCAAPGKN